MKAVELTPWRRLVFALLVLAAVAGPRPAAATAQVPDVIRIDGKTYPLLANPLEAYFAASGKSRPRFTWQHTANWRGYVAQWAVEDDQLYLTGLDGHIADKAVTLEDLFPGQKRVPATWFSGRLRVAVGELVRHVHLDYESVYDRELGLYVERGRVMLRTLVVNPP